MQLEAVTTSDRSLLTRVRGTLAAADAALLCVAFVQRRGVHLLADELRSLGAHSGARLVVTTTFASTDTAALSDAYRLGVRLKILNPGSGSSFHPKVYLGQAGRSVQAVIGSANLTGGLATNIEAGVWMKGTASDVPLRQMRDWAESMWSDPRAIEWLPTTAAEPRSDDDVLQPELHQAIVAAWRDDPVFRTLGPRPARNLVVEVTPSEVLIETERTRERRTGAQSVPAMMFNLAWDYLRAHGELSNMTLLNELRVHRSSAVCAILARLPGVSLKPRGGGGITLVWRKMAA